ncbi:hypothetical protein Tco_0200639 [Tanacetum coccineum]
MHISLEPRDRLIFVRTHINSLVFHQCGNKSILRVLRIILVILPEHPSETMVVHNEDGNPARANIKQALGSFKDGDGDGDTQPHKGVKASANSDIMYFFTSAQDGDPLQDDICLGVDLEPDEWIKDSGCSKHMTGNRKLFSSYKAYNGGNVIFGSNLRGNIIGKGQICDNKCRVTFSEHDSEITKDGKVIGRGIRKKGLYVMKLGNKPKDQTCLATIDENSSL